MTTPQSTQSGTSGHRELLALAAPIAATQLAQVALTTTDTVMLGLLGAEALAAGGLAIVLFNQIRTMGVGMVTAVGNQVAAATARGERAAAARGARPDGTDGEVRDLLHAAFLLATLAGLAGAALLVGAGYVLPWLGQDPTVSSAARAMLIALAPGLLPCLWFQVVRQYTVGMRRPKALVLITGSSVAVNVGLNWALVHGVAGLPRLGIAGIGAATSAVYLLTFLTLYAMTRRDPLLAGGLSVRAWRAQPATVRRLAGLGTPIAATYGSEAGFFSVVALIMGSLGSAALAAHTAVNQLVYIVFQVTVGLSHAASILVSREVAGHRPAAAVGIARTALIQGALTMTVVGAVYLVVPSLVLAPFFDPATPTSENGLAIAGTLLLIAAGLQFADTAQNIGVGLLRGLDDTRSGFRLTVIGYWAVGLPLVWVLARPLGLGAAGAWLGLACGLAVTAGLLLRRFHRVLATLHPTA
ncbi:MATE family efflux transporter [Micromonospora purpureochromogenes]|uniref:MATE family efflux transporter n=1 Tax=Micromonospora purpureochromogenes TaxID=47872 RepID=UPI0033CF937C